jgi:hypothetical protein
MYVHIAILEGIFQHMSSGLAQTDKSKEKVKLQIVDVV